MSNINDKFLEELNKIFDNLHKETDKILEDYKKALTILDEKYNPNKK